MDIKAVFQTIAAVTIAFILVFVSPTPAVVAANQSNQDMNQAALLFSPEPNQEISIYPKPDIHPRRIGYGMSGDPVTILEQVGSNEGHTWNYIRLDKPPYQKGWVREDKISFQESTHPEVSRSLRQRDDRLDKYNSGHQQRSDLYQQENQQYNHYHP